MRVMVTGGAGFIGSNIAYRLLQSGHTVVIVDNLSRPGSRENIRWLRSKGDLRFVKMDIQCCEAHVFEGLNAVMHLAGQVSAEASVVNPMGDFQTNAVGTVNLLEMVRNVCPQAAVAYASTNKIYGDLIGVTHIEREKRYELSGFPLGLPETIPLDFQTPYARSKYVGEAYLLDYSRFYGLRTVAFRQSCIYGPRQFGIESQGWVSWFITTHLSDKPLTIYGNGKQTRDLLFVDDLAELFIQAVENIDAVNGQAFNVGGGPTNSLSLLELLDIIEEMSGRPVSYVHSDSRFGDQRAFISDNILAKELLGWEPKVGIHAGIRLLYDWLVANYNLF